jgi:hypothetical protein
MPALVGGADIKLARAIEGMEGVWDGRRQVGRVHEDLILVALKGEVWIEVKSPFVSGKTKLIPKKLEGDAIVFTYTPQPYSPAGGKDARSAFVPILSCGSIRATVSLVEHAGPASPGKRIGLQFLEQGGRHFGSVQLLLTKPVEPPAQPMRLFLDPSWRYTYRDWRTRGVVDTTMHDARLKQTLEQLRRTAGWRVLNELSYTVTAETPIESIHTLPGITRMFLIFVSDDDSGLRYEFASQPPIYASLDGQTHDFPTLTTLPRTFFQSRLRFSFSLPPPVSTGGRSRPVELRLFVLGRTAGDY